MKKKITKTPSAPTSGNEKKLYIKEKPRIPGRLP